MPWIKFVLVHFLCLGFIFEIFGQNNPLDNYIKLKNHAKNIQYIFTGDVADFSQLHFPPLGPLSHYAGFDWCYKGVHTMYREKDYANSSLTFGSKDEYCSSTSWRDANSVRLQGTGSASSKVVHLYSHANMLGQQISYTEDMANVTQTIANSIIVVGEGVSATFYTLPDHQGESVCVFVGIGKAIFNIIYDTNDTFGFNTIRSFKFGCHSKKIIQPTMNSIVPDISI